jgi:hypothetical protein
MDTHDEQTQDACAQCGHTLDHDGPCIVYRPEAYGQRVAGPLRFAFYRISAKGREFLTSRPEPYMVAVTENQLRAWRTARIEREERMA